VTVQETLIIHQLVISAAKDNKHEDSGTQGHPAIENFSIQNPRVK
jgi:hypothetical protein